MKGAIHQTAMNTDLFVWFTNPEQIQFLNLYVNRNNLVIDTINQLVHQRDIDFKRPLKVSSYFLVE